MPGVRLSEFVKAYDVRGLVPEQLSPAVSRVLGSAFAQVVVRPEGHAGIVLGHDMRESSPALARAFAEGALEQGVDVTTVGLCSTDALYYASGSLRLPGAMVTASHNPARYNGIKLCRALARPVGQDTGLTEVRDLAQWLLDRGALHDLPRPARPGEVREHPVVEEYAEFLHGLVDISGIPPLTVVVDAGNGMAGHTAGPVLGRGGRVSVVPLYFELDGTFPNHPANPLEPENLRDLQAAVVEHGADLGLAFDGDADRCFVVDERGAPVSPSAVTALVAEREIAARVAAGADPAGIAVVHNVISSRVVPETVTAAGARAVRTRVGHSFVKAQMAEHEAVFGGEHSAHYYFRDFFYADSGMLAALHLLAALGSARAEEPGASLSRLVAGYERYAASGEINSRVQDVAAVTRRVREWGTGRGARADALDGLTLEHSGADGPYWAVSLRPSNTEPLLWLNVEAADRGTMEAVRDEVLRMVRA